MPLKLRIYWTICQKKIKDTNLKNIKRAFIKQIRFLGNFKKYADSRIAYELNLPNQI